MDAANAEDANPFNDLILKEKYWKPEY